MRAPLRSIVLALVASILGSCSGVRQLLADQKLSSSSFPSESPTDLIDGLDHHFESDRANAVLVTVFPKTNFTQLKLEPFEADVMAMLVGLVAASPGLCSSADLTKLDDLSRYCSCEPPGVVGVVAGDAAATLRSVSRRALSSTKDQLEVDVTLESFWEADGKYDKDDDEHDHDWKPDGKVRDPPGTTIAELRVAVHMPCAYEMMHVLTHVWDAQPRYVFPGHDHFSEHYGVPVLLDYEIWRSRVPHNVPPSVMPVPTPPSPHSHHSHGKHHHHSNHHHRHGSHHGSHHSK